MLREIRATTTLPEHRCLLGVVFWLWELCFRQITRQFDDLSDPRRSISTNQRRGTCFPRRWNSDWPFGRWKVMVKPNHYVGKWRVEGPHIPFPQKLCRLVWFRIRSENFSRPVKSATAGKWKNSSTRRRWTLGIQLAGNLRHSILLLVWNIAVNYRISMKFS